MNFLSFLQNERVIKLGHCNGMKKFAKLRDIFLGWSSLETRWLRNLE